MSFKKVEKLLMRVSTKIGWLVLMAQGPERTYYARQKDEKGVELKQNKV